MRKRDQNFPGDSECSLGIVSDDEGTSHVCLNCKGDGCKPKRQRRSSVRANRLMDLSGSTIFTDQKGRAVFLDLEKGTAFVMEDAQ